MTPTMAALPLVVLAIGLGITSLAIGAYFAVRGGSRLGERISGFIEADDASLPEQRHQADPFFARFRRRFNRLLAPLDVAEIEHKLAAANWQISGSEYLFFQVGSDLLTFMLGLLIFRNVFPAIGLAVLMHLIPGFLLFRSTQERRKRFQNQLVDSLTLIRGGVSAGYSFQQALNVVIQEMGPPTSDEFRQVRKEVELGLPLGRALENMSKRMQSDDFDLVVAVIIINMQAGGNLTTLLNVVIETIRQRVALFSEIRALTAYATFASYLLTFLPFVTVVILSLMSPLYWQQLLKPGLNSLCAGVCSLQLDHRQHILAPDCQGQSLRLLI